MADVLGSEPRSLPRWAYAAAALGVIGVLLVLAARSPRAPSPTPVADASPSPSPAGPSPLPSAATAANACGGDVTLPLYGSGPQLAPTGLRLLVGDRDLRLVDVDSGRTRVLTTSGHGRAITQLAWSGRSILAVMSGTCANSRIGDGEIGSVDPVTGRVTARGRGDEILPGSPATAVQMSETGPVLVRSVGTRATTRVPEPWFPLARVGRSYLVSVGGGPDGPPTLGIGNPATGRVTRTFGVGSPVAASDSDVLWTAGECPGTHCLLTTSTLDGINSAQPISGNAWGGVFSPDNRRVAFRLGRSSGRLGDHPGPPNDVAILDTLTGELQVLPDFVLPAKAPLTLTWSPDGEWLVLGADLGQRPLILLWHRGMAQLTQVTIPATGGGTTGAPALLVLPQSPR